MEKKRVRDGACNRWSMADKKRLLEIILQDPANFERPTARLYYNKLIERHEQFLTYGWKGIRDKMRNLRSNYTKAVDWRNNTGTDIGEEDAETTTREYVIKLCEDFDALDVIFGSRSNITLITPLFLHESGESSSSSALLQNVDEVKDVLHQTNIEFLPHPKIEEGNYEVLPTDDPLQVESPPPPTSSNSGAKRQRTFNNSTAFLAEIQREKIVFLREKLECVKVMETKRLKIEEEKIALEKEKVQNAQANFKEECRLKELEIKNNFQLNKMRLEKEMLELKYKYNKD